MKAAVVTAFDHPPRYLERDEPSDSDDSMVVELIAAGLHPRVRSQASGSHYTSTDEPSRPRVAPSGFATSRVSGSVPPSPQERIIIVP
jgi:hypothetical protein